MVKKIASLVLLLTGLYLLTSAQLLTENFDSTAFPPAGWTNVRISGAASPGTWLRTTAGTNPICSPHSGAAMAYYNSYSWSSGNAGDLATPALDFSSGSYAVSFWMYRDGSQSLRYDSVCVYVNTTTSSAGGTLLGVINRFRGFAPVESANGWYQYTFNVPAAYNTATNHIIFKATSDFGSRIHMDDVSVYAITATPAPTSITASATSVCPGGAVMMHAQGIDGMVYWYSGSCGGSLVGTGDSIQVIPTQSTTYYARNYNNGTFSTNCASINVQVNQVYNTTESQTLCAHQSITLPGGVFADTTGTYVYTVASSSGCDSTITLYLTVLAPIIATQNQTVCFGQSYTFNGHTYNGTGNYNDTLTASNGCDSMVTTHLTVLPQIQSSVNATVCLGQSYSYHGHTYSSSGNYNDTLTASNGCDSIHTLHLTVSPQATGTQTLYMCPGDSVFFNGNFYNNAGTYYDTLSTAGGCDSIITLLLSMFQTDTPHITQNGFTLSSTTQPNYQWYLNGAAISSGTNQTFTATQDGTYYVQATDSNGCTTQSASVVVFGTAINDITATTIHIYPNPAVDYLHIQGLVYGNFYQVGIYNALGQEVISQPLTDNNLYIGLLPAGVYRLGLTSNGKTQTVIFIKQ